MLHTWKVMEDLQSRSTVKTNIHQRNHRDMTVRRCEEREEINKRKLRHITTKGAAGAGPKGWTLRSRTRLQCRMGCLIQMLSGVRTKVSPSDRSIKTAQSMNLMWPRTSCPALEIEIKLRQVASKRNSKRKRRSRLVVITSCRKIWVQIIRMMIPFRFTALFAFMNLRFCPSWKTKTTAIANCQISSCIFHMGSKTEALRLLSYQNETA